jgi:hypothetical protein
LAGRHFLTGVQNFDCDLDPGSMPQGVVSMKIVLTINRYDPTSLLVAHAIDGWS